MKSVLISTLLCVVFVSSSLLTVKQVEGKKAGVGKLVGSLHEKIDVRRNLKQDTPESKSQEIKSEFSKGVLIDADRLNIEKAQGSTKTKEVINKKELQYDKREVSEVGKNIGRVERGQGNKEMNKSLVFTSTTDFTENIANLQKSLQIGEKVDIEENEYLEKYMDKLLKEKDQAKKEEEKLQRRIKLDRGEKLLKEWYQKNMQKVHKRQYDNFNEHLPVIVFIDDYIKQLFYCIKKNNLVCLRGIIDKLEKLGLIPQEIMSLRNNLGDTPLIYAVKQGEVDVVRFLLLQGANPKVVNNSFQSPIDIAVEREKIDMINAITEMMPHLLEYKRINNKESSEMYTWAVKTKEDNELQCNEDQER